ncbi:MAG: acylphosphatase [Hyphomicrobiaceae bacterium]|nr:acylphosphatase [Hyphomicrobiaceae bacterium]
MIPRGERNPYHQISTIKVLIEGRVQGVWFRGWTVENARELDLDGWVQNRRDGTVQAVFSGPDYKIQEMLRRCEEGPPLADVAAIKAQPHTHDVQRGFRVRRSR